MVGTWEATGGDRTGLGGWQGPREADARPRETQKAVKDF